MTYGELKEKLLQLNVSDDAEVTIETAQSTFAVEDCSYCTDSREVTLYTKEGLKAFFTAIYRGSNKLDDILEEI